MISADGRNPKHRIVVVGIARRAVGAVLERDRQILPGNPSGRTVGRVARKRSRRLRAADDRRRVIDAAGILRCLGEKRIRPGPFQDVRPQCAVNDVAVRIDVRDGPGPVRKLDDLDGAGEIVGVALIFI